MPVKQVIGQATMRHLIIRTGVAQILTYLTHSYSVVGLGDQSHAWVLY